MRKKLKTGNSVKAVRNVVCSLVFATGLFLSAFHTKAAGDVAISPGNFPDANFRTYLSNSFDKDKNGSLSSTEIDEVKTLLCSGRGITNLKGVEKFPSLEILDCGTNITEFPNLRSNTKLKELWFVNCEFEDTVDISFLTNLEELHCYGNYFDTLDLSNNRKLKVLDVKSNQLEYLDLSNNPNMVSVECSDNTWLAGINVSKCTSLETLNCKNNPITSLNVSNNTSLQYLRVSGSDLSSITFGENKKLIEIQCDRCKLTSLDVSKCTALAVLYCQENNLSKLDVANCISLRDVQCYYNKISVLDIRNCDGLVDVYKNGNKAAGSTFTNYNMTKNRLQYRLLVDNSTKIIADKAAAMKITLSNISTGVKITWNAESGAAKYQIFKKNASGSWNKLTELTALNYTDKSVSPAEKCTYTVIGVGSDGVALNSYGDGTSIVCSLPMETSVRVRTAGVGVSWSKAGVAVKYGIYRKTGTADWTQIAVSTSESYTDQNAIYGKTYLYAVRAMDASGNCLTEPGNGAEITYLVPAPAITLSNTEKGISVSWKEMTDAAQYQVYVKKPSGRWARLTTTTATSYIDPDTENGVSYTYAVVGLDAKEHTMNDYGNGETIVRRSNYVNISLSKSNAGVKISWPSFGGADKYRVYRKNEKGNWTKLGVTGDLSFTDAGAAVKATNTYTVIAVNADKQVLTEYGLGKSIRFTLTPTIVVATVKSKGVRLDWEEVGVASRYRVFRKTRTTEWKKVGETAGLSYTDKTVESGKTYYYSVVALNANKKTINGYGEGIKVKFTSTKTTTATTKKSVMFIEEEIEGTGILEEVAGFGIVVEESLGEEGIIEEVTEELTEEVTEEENSDEEVTDEAITDEEITDEETADEAAEEDVTEEITDEEADEITGEEIKEEISEDEITEEVTDGEVTGEVKEEVTEETGSEDSETAESSEENEETISEDTEKTAKNMN